MRVDMWIVVEKNCGVEDVVSVGGYVRSPHLHHPDGYHDLFRKRFLK